MPCLVVASVSAVACVGAEISTSTLHTTPHHSHNIRQYISLYCDRHIISSLRLTMGISYASLSVSGHDALPYGRLEYTMLRIIITVLQALTRRL